MQEGENKPVAARDRSVGTDGLAPARRPARGQHQAQAEMFQLLAQSVQDYAIFLLDTTGHVTSWNAGAQRIKGYAPDEIIGRHFSLFYPPEDARRGKPDYALRVAADDGRWEDEGWRIRKDGTRFWASVDITALRDEQGQLRGFAKITRDLTERKRADEERERLLVLERTAREEAGEAVERLRMVQSITDAALAHLELDRLLGTLLERIAEFLAADTAAVLLLEGDELVARAARGLEEEVERGVRIPVGRGFAGQVAAQRQPIVIEDVDHADVFNPLLREKRIRSLLGVPLVVEGRVLGVLHVGTLYARRFTPQDVQLLQLVADRAALAIEHARLVEAERVARHEAEAAEMAVRVRDEFLALAAHELKTPITSLRGVAQLAVRRLDRAGELKPEQLRAILQTIDAQSAKLSTLVGQLLEVARDGAGQFEVVRAFADVVPIIRGAVGMAQARSPQREITLAAPPEAIAWVDALRLEQVVVNLLDNALKFSADDSRVEVEVAMHLPASPSGAVGKGNGALPGGRRRKSSGDAGSQRSETSAGTLCLAVRDHGIGVAPQHRRRLFERFYQAHARDYRSGLGLGLYICRRIVELHGGTIAAEFPADGGTRMAVCLPVAPADGGGAGA